MRLLPTNRNPSTQIPWPLRRGQMQGGARTHTGAYWVVREDDGQASGFAGDWPGCGGIGGCPKAPDGPPHEDASQRQRSRWPLLNGSGMRGFTFLEVILALTLFTFGLLAITRMFGFSAQAIQFSGNRTKAILVAQEKLEALKSIPYNNLLDEDRLTEIASKDGIHTFQDTQGLIQRTWTIQKDQPIVGLGLIKVRTAWIDAGGKTKEVSFVTLQTNLDNGREERR